jgi:hypothetical protein
VVIDHMSLTSPVEALLASLRLSLTGAVSDRVAPFPNSSHPVVATTFGAGSTAVPVDVGTGLWAVLRTSSSGEDRVLCVHNASDRVRTFAPAPHLTDGSAPLVFLSGETSTTEAEDGLRCELRSHGFVWLGTGSGRSPGEDTR